MKRKIPNYIEVEESMAGKARKIMDDVLKTEERENVRFEPEYVNMKLAEAAGFRHSVIGGNLPLILALGSLIAMVVIDWLL